jgi:nucleolar protein 4
LINSLKKWDFNQKVNKKVLKNNLSFVLILDERKVEKKRQKSLLKLKKSRIIIRNLSFKANEDIIKESFGKFGNVIEVNIPKKSNGKMFGYAFVGFDAIKSALKAIKYMNEKELLNRTIAVDFALAKKAFTSHNLKSEESLEDNEDNDNSDESEENDNEVKDEILDEEQVEDESDDEYISDDNSENDGKHSQSKKKIDVKQLTDASEEKTIFVRNLSFSSTAESLNELMSKFGETYYCKICVDQLMEHSKGTAFVKFKNKTDAEKCLQEAEIQNNNNLYLDGRYLNVSLAVTRNKLKELEEKRSFKEKDKRNLYLAKEGLIYPESPAAEGVSQTDLKKRLAVSY